MSRGVVLLNLGTPASPEIPDVRRYLAEFLMDPLVLDIPAVWRFLMVYGTILPKRPRVSAEAYKKIWTERGSPLAFHLSDLSNKVTARLKNRGDAFSVYTAMRYGQPSVRSALERAKQDGISRLTVFPLYPQYSLAATESSLEKVKAEAEAIAYGGELSFVPPFFEHSGFIRAFAKGGKAATGEFKPDYVLFSFHGLPERQIRKAKADYRVQCFETAHAIAQEMGFARDEFERRYSVAFQSRLGRTPWIRPYTDLVIPELASQGVKRLAVLCPSFVADCLETIEEIGIRARASFAQAGGGELRLVSSLNSSDDWADVVCELIETAISAKAI